MFKITVSTTHSAMFCLVAVCFAGTAQADMIGAVGIGNAPAAVSDALLASTRAVNLPSGVVTNIGGARAATVAPVNATTVANNVRLWDEVIPPAPSPKPTQVSLTLPQPATMVAAPQRPQMASPGIMAVSLKTNVGAPPMPSATLR